MPLTSLDRESVKEYRIPLRTRDLQGVSGLRTLVIEVQDENDSPMTDGFSNITGYWYICALPACIYP